MDAVGKLIEVMPVESGVSQKGNQWVKIGFIVNLREKGLKAPKPYHFQSMDSGVIDFISNTSIDSILRITYDISCRKYKERWFTSLMAFRVEILKENDNIVTDQEDLKNYADEIADKYLRKAAKVITQPAQEEVGDDSDLPF